MDSRREFHTHLDPFAAVNADVRDVDVLFVGESDSITPAGTKGRDLAIPAAAIANAVYHDGHTGPLVADL